MRRSAVTRIARTQKAIAVAIRNERAGRGSASAVQRAHAAATKAIRAATREEAAAGMRRADELIAALGPPR